MGSLHDIALFGCLTGIEKYRSEDQKLIRWFQGILNSKKTLMGPHKDFSNAIRGDEPTEGTYYELFLFRKLEIGGDGELLSQYVSFMSTKYRFTFPYFYDYFRDLISVKVLELGLGHLGKLFEEMGKDILMISPQGKAKLDKAKRHIRKARLENAMIEIKYALANHQDSHQYYTLLGIESAFSNFRDKQTQGVLSSKEESLTHSQLTAQLLSLIRSLGERKKLEKRLIQAN